MKQGDIVNFYSSLGVWMRDYKGKSPGLILAINNNPTRRPSARVLWRDGTTTDEHISYLSLASVK